MVDSAIDTYEKRLKRHASDLDSEKTITSWKGSYHWLLIIDEGRERKLKCSVCTEQKVNSIWANEGSTNFQKNSIERHGSSAEHKCAEEKICRKRRSESVIDSEVEPEEVSCNDDDLKLFRTIFYVAKEELPNDKINSLLELQNLNGANIKYKNISWDTVTEIQSCICTVIQREIVEEMKLSNVYAVMIDESTDLAVQKHLSVCVRYVKDGEAVTRFLANVFVADGKSTYHCE